MGWNEDPELTSTLRLGGLQGQIQGGERSLERQSQPNGTVECISSPPPGHLAFPCLPSALIPYADF